MNGSAIDGAAKRLIAAIVGGVFGLAVGVLLALAVVGFGPWFIPTIGLAAAAGIVVAIAYPTPFLFFGSLVIDIFASG